MNMIAECDYREDMRILCQARAVGANGPLVVRRHIDMLLREALQCLQTGDSAKARTYCNRVEYFAGKYFHTEDALAG